MSHKLLWRQTSKCKSWSVYHNSFENTSKSEQNTTYLDNPIRKVINDESNLSHEHLAKGSTYAPRMKPDVIQY